MKRVIVFRRSGAGQGRRAAAAVRCGLMCGFGWLAGCAGNAGNAGPELPAGGGGASFGPGYPPGSSVWSKEARSAYRTAFMAGMQDQREGFRYDDDRGAAALDVEERGFYRQGYRRGYYHEANVRRAGRRTGAGTAEKTSGDNNSLEESAPAQENAGERDFSSTAIRPHEGRPYGRENGM